MLLFYSDDGNNDDTDGCSNTCRNPKCGVSTYYDCHSIDELDFCICLQDGIVQKARGEECDLGKGNSRFGKCNEKCVIARCGDGIHQKHEQW